MKTTRTDAGYVLILLFNGGKSVGVKNDLFLVPWRRKLPNDIRRFFVNKPLNKNSFFLVSSHYATLTSIKTSTLKILTSAPPYFMFYLLWVEMFTEESWQFEVVVQYFSL